MEMTFKMKSRFDYSLKWYTASTSQPKYSTTYIHNTNMECNNTIVIKYITIYS